MKIALCLAGGGITGAMYQVGALAALEDGLEGLSSNGFDLYVGVASGGTVASALAGGQGVQRLYRALLDPADNYFPLQRHHLLRMAMDEWRRLLRSGYGALQHGSMSLLSRSTPPPSPARLWRQLDRFYDSLPAGLFSLDRYERFLSEFFLRRGISNSFRSLPKELRVLGADLDTGESVIFGGSGEAHVPVSLACAASMALPLFFSPVRVGQRQIIDGSFAPHSPLDVAEEEAADLVISINPMVPMRASRGEVPTGHGVRSSLRDKGLMWVYNQSLRMDAQARRDWRRKGNPEGYTNVLELSPRADDALLFLHNPASFARRRELLETAYKSTRAQLQTLVEERPEFFAKAGMSLRPSPSLAPPAKPADDPSSGDEGATNAGSESS